VPEVLAQSNLSCSFSARHSVGGGSTGYCGTFDSASVLQGTDAIQWAKGIGQGGQGCVVRTPAGASWVKDHRFRRRCHG
jgi:hypothetical protein